MENVKLEGVTKPIEIPKGLFWTPEIRSLYFIDIYQSNIHRYVPDTKEHYIAKVGNKSLSFVIPFEDTLDEFIISYGTDISIIKWDGCSDKVEFKQTIANVDERPQNRINNGKVSPDGILFFGTTGGSLPNGEPEREVAALYTYTKSVGVKKVLSKVSISNGMAWSRDLTKFFYIDTPNFTVDVYDYNSSDGSISNGKVLYDFKNTNTEGAPDGLTIDAEDNLWITCWDGFQIIKISSNGILLGKIRFPAARVTSATFAGPNLNDMYVTTAFYGLTADQRKQYEQSGVLFKLTNIQATGLPDVKISG